MKDILEGAEYIYEYAESFMSRFAGNSGKVKIQFKCFSRKKSGGTYKFEYFSNEKMKKSFRT